MRTSNPPPTPELGADNPASVLHVLSRSHLTLVISPVRPLRACTCVCVCVSVPPSFPPSFPRSLLSPFLPPLYFHPWALSIQYAKPETGEFIRCLHLPVPIPNGTPHFHLVNISHIHPCLPISLVKKSAKNQTCLASKQRAEYMILF